MDAGPDMLAHRVLSILAGVLLLSPSSASAAIWSWDFAAGMHTLGTVDASDPVLLDVVIRNEDVVALTSSDFPLGPSGQQWSIGPGADGLVYPPGARSWMEAYPSGGGVQWPTFTIAPGGDVLVTLGQLVPTTPVAPGLYYGSLRIYEPEWTGGLEPSHVREGWAFSFTVVPDGAAAHVPEPTTLSLLVVGLLGLSRHKQRKH